MPQAGYFDVPFAEDGDLNTIPDTVQSNGSVSYPQGFPILYSTPVASGGYNFPRTSHNQALNDITTAIQAIQQTGIPPYFPYITANGGYEKYALTLYTDGHIYQSLVAANTVVPTNDIINWRVVDASGSRIKLPANQTLYISTSGNDSTGNGTSSAPWATIQHAINFIATNIDLAGFTIAIQLADGTYTAPLESSIPFVGGNYSNIIINGDPSTPSNVLINVTSNNAFYAVTPQTGFTLENMKIENNTSGNCVLADQGAVIVLGAGIIFGASSGAHIQATNNGLVNAVNNYTIAGSAAVHATVSSGLININAIAITLSGTPAFTDFAKATTSGVISSGATFSGAATGVRYSASSNGVINTNGAGATYFPGSSAGTTATGGQYV